MKKLMPVMMADHRAVSETLAEFRDAAAAMQKEDCLHLAEKLAMHAQMEEEVLYPHGSSDRRVSAFEANVARVNEPRVIRLSG
ncbi:MAG: hypothetical protein M5R36_18910 [Deltaproteobacteria bacterium]|nr:hypothetical protein [Deltaproteobacteria bacterium]